MKSFATAGITLVFILTAALPATADELDEVLDDLVAFREAAATQAPSSVAQTATVSLFAPVAHYRSDAVSRVEEDGVAEFNTTYYAEQGGTSFEVRYITPLQRATFVLHGKLKETAALYYQASRVRTADVQGLRGAYVGYKDGKARGISIALGNNSFVIIRASRATSVEELRSFAALLNLEQLKAPSEA